MFGWFKKKEVKKTELVLTEEEILLALANYAKTHEPNRDFSNKVAEVNSMMFNKNSSDPVIREAIMKAIDAWAEGLKTPKEFKEIFRR